PISEPHLPPAHPAYPFLYGGGKDTYKKQQERLPEESEVQLAKAFLMGVSEKSGTSVYDHLTQVIVRILENRIEGGVDIFESISADVKRSKFQAEQVTAPGGFRKEPPYNPQTEISSAQIKLFERLSPEDQADRSSGEAGEVPDVMDLSNLWEWAGVSLSPPETFTTFLSMQNLSSTKPLKSLRLWGKILGLQSNYIIVEGELRDGAVDEDEEEANREDGGDDGEKKESEDGGEGKEGGEKEASGEEGESEVKREQKKRLPKEVRSGVNKYVYYVCGYGEFSKVFALG
ncbi:Radial spoke head protein 4 A, partial [Rhizophlyctis rosea]